MLPHGPVYRMLAQRHHDRQPTLALLLDPDRVEPQALPTLLPAAEAAGVGLLMVGGSLLTTDRLSHSLQLAKAHTRLPVLLFPGHALQLAPGPDAVLWLSLISGRNPDLLVGQHVVAAPRLQALGLEAIPTGYMLVEGGRSTSALYISNTQPLPAHKPDLAATTALAGWYLGLRALYLDAGSGALNPVPPALIAAVRQAAPLPLFVGGGLRQPEQVAAALEAGADVVVMGTAFEGPDALAQLQRFSLPRLQATRGDS